MMQAGTNSIPAVTGEAPKRFPETLIILPLILAVGLWLVPSPSLADTVSWVGGAGVWSQSTNWSLHLPAAGDTVVITNNGNVTLDVSASIGSLILGTVTNCGGGALSLNGQVLSFSGQVQVNPCGALSFSGGQLFATGGGALSGIYTWSGGAYPFGGNTVLGPNAILNITGGADHDMPSVTLTNYGYVAWSGGRIRGGGTPGSFIYNYGIWDSQGDLTFNSDFNQQGLVFNNLGTFRKSAGTGSTVFSPNNSLAYLNNVGTLDVQTGSLVLNGGASLTGGSVIGAGLLYLNTGGFTLKGTVTTARVLLSGGVLVGDNVLSGGFTWSSGNWNSANSVTLATNSELDIVSGSDHDLANCVFTNLGTVEWLAGRLRGGSTPGTWVYNLGTWEARCDQVFNSDFGQVGVVFNNLGTFRKLGTTNSTTFSPNNSEANFINSGLVDIQSGSIVLNGGGLLNAGSVTGSGVFYLNSGGFTLNGMQTTVSNVQFTGGSFVGSSTIVGGLSWVAGNWDGATSVLVPSGSELDIVGNADHDLASCMLVNGGTVEWLAGRLRGGSTPSSTIYNSGLWEARCDQAFNSDFGQSGVAFYNTGTFRKIASTGSTTFAPNNSQDSFVNGGVVDVESGSIVLNGGGTFTNGMVSGPGVLYLNGGGFSLNGGFTTAATVLFTGGTFVGNNTILGSLSWSAGNWDGTASVTVATNSELDIISTSDHDLLSCVLTNLGKVEWLNGRLRGGGTPGTLIYNLGTWEAQCDQAINSDLGQYGLIFNNLGTFRKIVTTNNTSVNPNNSSAAFNNIGTIDIQTGSLVLNGGGTFSGGSVTGSRPVYLNAGGFTINGTLTTTNVQETGGALVGANVLRGSFIWASGNWNSADSVTVASGAELDITSSTDHDLANCTVTNLGTVEWLNGRIRGGSTPGTLIYNSGLWEVRCDLALNSDLGQVGVRFYNSGTFRKLATSGSTSFSPNNAQASFNNTGLIDIQTGALVLNGGGTFTGGSVVGNGPVYFSGGGFTVNGATTTLNTILAGGVLAGVNVLNGGFTWSSGNWNGAGPVTLTAGSELDITSAPDHDMTSCIFTNLGHVKWLGGRIRGGSTPGTVIYNAGLWDTQCDSAMNSDFGQFGLVFNNNNPGTFRKSVTLGVTSINPNNSQAVFNNQGGGIELDSGTFSLPGNFAQNGGPMTFGLGGTTNGQWGVLTCAGSATLNGPLNVILENGFAVTTGNQFRILSCANPFRIGQFTSTSLPFGITVNYQPAAVILVATSNGAPQLLAPTLSDGQFSFSFPSTSGQGYTVQQNTDVNTTNWTFYTNLTGTGGLLQVVTPTANTPRRFFRIVTD
jgi:hypothetical protein